MSTKAKSHGMDGALVEPDWPPLTIREVRSLLRDFEGFSEPIRILSLSPRPFSAACLAASAHARVFVKRHHCMVRDCEGLLEEHRFVEHLRRRGAQVPRVLASKSGETAIEEDEWTYEVHEAPAGVDLYADAHSWTPFRSAHHAFSAGRALAQLHCAALEYHAPVRRPRPLIASFTIFAGPNPRAAMDRYLAARPALAGDTEVKRACDVALELLAPFHAELSPHLRALEPLWTHNDLHASNLFWSGETDEARTVAVIDFGLADRTNAVHDLAHAIERNIVEWLALVAHPDRPEAVPVHFDHLDALLSGYESVRPFAAHEAAALAAMTALCHAEFALSEAGYFLGVLQARESARMAYDGWLVGHARWFSSGAGARLLEAIRQWAKARAPRTKKEIVG
jgi:Ser/Thr protein kinase RdoA (MazF antagonist)